MSAMSAYVVILALLGAAPGETTGWGTGEVAFTAYVDTDEHREIYPVCAGQYTVEVSIIKVSDDPCDVLSDVTSVEICYQQSQNLVHGAVVDVTGTYYDGACPIPFCGRVEASSVYKTNPPDGGEDDDGEDNPDIVSPEVVTGSAEATETTVTLRAVLVDDGGSPCRVRFVYWKYDGPHWQTEWIEGQSSRAVLSQTIAGLIPNTVYFYYAEAENLEHSDSGRMGSFMTLPETVPPIPQPAIWLAEPDQIDTSSIGMMAEVARDVSGPEEYVFDFVSSPTGGAGGNSQNGAGIQLVRSDIIIAQCTIQQNRSGRLSGDGLVGWGQGAGVSCFYGEPVLLACTFQFNWAGGWGGALHSLKSNPVLRDCIFQTNHAGMQGGVLCLDDSSSVVVDCLFQGNRSWDGGAVFGGQDGNCRLTNCRFLGNAGFGSGGAVYSAGRSLQIINSLFSGNLSFLDGGAVALTQGAAVLTNCSFNRNVSQGALGGGALAVFGATAELANCIFWDQAAPEQALIALQGADEQEAGLSVSYSNVMGGADGITKKGRTSVTWGAKNLDRDPSFRSAAGVDGIAGTADDDLRLRAGSACIDAGNNTAVPTDADDLDLDEDRAERIPLDLDGRSRFADDPDTPDTGTPDSPAYRLIVDLGAYEFVR